MSPIHLKREEMNEYVHFLLRLLADKYHISLPSFARAIHKHDGYIHQFATGRRKLRYDNLQLIESELIDLYAPILDIEMKLNRLYLQDLFERGDYTAYEENFIDGKFVLDLE